MGLILTLVLKSSGTRMEEGVPHLPGIEFEVKRDRRGNPDLLALNLGERG
jgi:hypothetical protein